MTLLKLDTRGRVGIASAVRKNGVEPSELWDLTFGPDQILILTPVSVIPTQSKEK